MVDDGLLLLFIILAVIACYRLRFLTLSGCIAAAIVGILTVIGLHIKGLFLLGVFFATSSFWSKYKRLSKQKVEERLEKGSQRDWQQVVANGGAAALVSFIYYVSQDPLWIAAYCILIASANSDTWASEIGTLSKKPPLDVRTFSIVANGTSGAISLLGTIAALMGSLLIAVLSSYLFAFSLSVTILIFLFGFFGNVLDTLLGAFIQAVYKCPVCQLETEKHVHCHEKTSLVRGSRFFNNEIVNFLSGFLAMLIAIVCFLFERTI